MALIIPYQSQAGIQTANAGPAAQYRGAEDFYAASGGGSLSRGLQQLAGGTEKLGDVLFEETIRKRREVMELTLIKDVQNFQAEAQAWEDEYRKKNQGHNAIKAEEDAKDFYDKKINALEERWAGNGAALIHIRKNAGSMAVSGVNGMRDYGNEQMDAHRLAETNTQLATAQATFTSPNSTEEDRERDFNTWSRMHTYNLTKAGMPPERAQQEIEAVRKSLETARFETRFKARLDSGDIEGARAELEDIQRRSAAGAAGTDEGAEAGGNAAGQTAGQAAENKTGQADAVGAAGTGEGAGGSAAGAGEGAGMGAGGSAAGAAGTGEGAGMGAGGSAAAGAGAAGNESGLTENGPDTAKAGANAGKGKIGPNQSENASGSAPESGPGTGKTASKSAPESGPESALAGSAAAKSETGANAGEGKPKPPAKPPLLSPESVRACENALKVEAERRDNAARQKGRIILGNAEDSLKHGLQTGDFSQADDTAAQLEGLGLTKEAAEVREAAGCLKVAQPYLKDRAETPIMEMEANAQREINAMSGPEPDKPSRIKTTQKIIGQELQRRRQAFSSDPAGYVAANPAMQQEGMTARQRVATSLHLQKTIGAGLRFAPKILTKQEASALRDEYDKAGDYAAKAKIIKEQVEIYGQYAPNAFDEIGLPRAVLAISQVVPDMTPSVAARFIAAAEATEETLPQVHPGEKRDYQRRVSSLPLYKAIKTSSSALHTSEAQQAFAADMGKTLVNYLQLGGRLEDIEKSFSIINEPGTAIVMPAGYDMSRISGALDQKRWELVRNAHTAEPPSEPEEGTPARQNGKETPSPQNSASQASKYAFALRATYRDGVWVWDGQGFSLVSQQTGKIAPGPDGAPVSVSLEETGFLNEAYKAREIPQITATSGTLSAIPWKE